MDTHTAPTSRCRRIRLPLVLGAIVAALALGACAREPSGDVHEGPGGPDAVSVVMTDDEFDPAELRLEAGTVITVETHNEGNAGHNFTVDDLDVSTGTVEPGAVVSATFTVPSQATEFRCTFHPGMRGEIVPT
ncbi:MAG TPA: cupredoxin domain-containing protein [Actinomycetota bacterium]|nr:cupredoxin domain-containing protein [Actinomycetota bacterium]